MNPFSLEGKRILITGASSGIGRQIAISCAAMGATCVISGRDMERLAATLAALAGEHVSIPADLTDPAQRSALADGAGTLNGVVHSAGIYGMVPLRMASEKHLRDMQAINYEAPLLLTQALLKKKAIIESSSIVFINSLSANVGAIGNAAYAGSKAALVAASRCLALEVARQKIRVNQVMPSTIDTPMLDKNGIRANVEAITAAHPLGFGRPDDVANAVLYFVSDASRWVTGNVHIVDGGYTLG
jgi:NAD(P)-dependent dehydrogenase (short-subunit alcohol dehydrogenase family)